jgi:AraC-like DNA-binding protein
MFDFVPYLSFLTSGMGFFFIVYLLIRFGHLAKIYWLVSIIFSLIFLEFYIYTLTSKHIYKMLFMLRSPNIFRAFLPILLYFYVIGMLNPKKKIKAIQWINFLFPFLVFIGVLPDLFLNSSEKISILDSYYEENTYLLNRPIGIIPSGVLQPVSILVGIIYSGVSLIKVFRAKKVYGETYVFVNKQNLIWLKLLSLIIMIYFFLQFYQYSKLAINHSFDPPSQLLKCGIGILLFTYFLSSADVQENMDGCIITQSKDKSNIAPSISDINPNLLSQFELDQNAVLIDIQVRESKCFLRCDCDLQNMAKIANHTPQKFSKLIKYYYGISYIEFVNRLRIYNFLTHINNYNQYTLETYIYESGYSNRSTFYAAFKKYVGVNPSFYLKELKS